jgi:hypothetical protein
VGSRDPCLKACQFIQEKIIRIFQLLELTYHLQLTADYRLPTPDYSVTLISLYPQHEV